MERELKAEWDEKYANNVQTSGAPATAGNDQTPTTNPDEQASTVTEVEQAPATMKAEGEHGSITDPHDEDDEVIMHLVLEGQGLAASRWYLPTDQIATTSEVEIVSGNAQELVVDVSELKSQFDTVTPSQGVGASRPSAPVKGLAASRHNPDRH